MAPVEICPGIYSVGVQDPDLRIFDVIMHAEHGTSYNSYLVCGSAKAALIETVKAPFTDKLIANLRKFMDCSMVQYIVVNHAEPDHSGALPRVLELAPNATVLATKMGHHFLSNIINRPYKAQVVSDGERISLGDKELVFLHAPFIHWPDTMMTYVPQDKALFPCDFLGSHFADERLFNDQVDDFSYSFRYYYDHIMRPFKEYVLKAIEKLRPLEIELIGPSHGPVLRRDPWSYINAYEAWSKEPAKEAGRKHLLVFYASSYGNTARMAQAIAKGAEQAGVVVSVFDLLATEIPSVLNLIEGCDGMAVGTATINGDAVKPVWDLLSNLATLKLKGKVGAAFGSYGWGGEGPALVEERLKGLKFRLAEPALKVTLVPTEDDLAKCQEFGGKLAAAIGGAEAGRSA